MERVANRRLQGEMNLKIRKLVDLDAFDPFSEISRQIFFADHFDKRRIRIAIRDHRDPGLPFATVTQTDPHSASVRDEDFFHMVNRSNLTAVVNVSALQDLRDGMGASAR